MSVRRQSIFLVGALAIAACATSGSSGEGTGTVGGGGRIDSGGDATTPPYGGPDDGAAPGTDAGAMTMSDTGIIITDSSSPADASTDTSPTGHIECPTTLYYATEAVNAPPTATVCTMGGPECLANVECCYFTTCVPYP
jgi:hypothetical protein